LFETTAVEEKQSKSALEGRGKKEKFELTTKARSLYNVKTAPTTRVRNLAVRNSVFDRPPSYETEYKE